MIRSVNLLSVKSLPNPDAPTWDHTKRFLPADAMVLAEQMLRTESVEVSLAFYLNHHNKLLGVTEISRGTLGCTITNPRDIIKVGLLVNAFNIVIAHNHPEEFGDVLVSPGDFDATEAVENAAALMQMMLLDHIVVGRDRSESIMQKPSPITLKARTEWERRKKVQQSLKQLAGMGGIFDIIGG